jgi:anti-sigma B factor antagonist
MNVGLQIEVRHAGEVTILDLVGRATIGYGNDLLTEKLRTVVEEGHTRLLVNLAGLRQIDSSGISTLVRTFVTLGRTGGTLKLLKPSGRVHDVLDVTRLLTAIPTFQDESQALATFS